MTPSTDIEQIPLYRQTEKYRPRKEKERTWTTRTEAVITLIETERKVIEAAQKGEDISTMITGMFTETKRFLR